jgi:hypothetical protein
LTDWGVFRSAVLALFSGQNPYSVGQGEMRFFNPPWMLLPIAPLAALPPLTGLLLNGIISLLALLFVSRRLKLSKWEFFLLAICPMHLQSMVFGNVEWLPLLGLLFPAPIALLFFTTKPQSTLGFILLTLLRQWKAGRWRGLALALAPTAVFAIISVVLWGLPPVPGPNNPGQHSLFPFSLLLGIPALILALRNQDDRMAGFVGPFVSPYVTFHGYLPALLPFRGKWMVVGVVISFIPVLLGIVA